MRTKFYETFCIENGDDDDGETEVCVTYTYYPGCPEQGPSYDSGGQPAEAPEVEIIECTRLDDTKVEIRLTDAQESRIHQWLVENHESEGPPEYE